MLTIRNASKKLRITVLIAALLSATLLITLLIPATADTGTNNKVNLLDSKTQIVKDARVDGDSIVFGE